jgi:hypothetical protein
MPLVVLVLMVSVWAVPPGGGFGEQQSPISLTRRVTDAYVCRLLLLTCLAPEIVEAILDGGSRRG